MSKLTLNSVGNLIDATTAEATLNDNFSTIASAWDNNLSRDGTSPNTMEASLDMDSNRILNLPAPVSAGEPVRLQELSTVTGGGTVSNIPAGGTTGQVLTKLSGTDYAITWGPNGGGVAVVAGTNISVTGSGTVTVATIANPNFATSVTTPSLILNGTTISGTTGTGNAVLSTSPTMITPILGTPTSGTLTNCTGLPVSTGISGFGTNVGTFLATPTSANLAAALTDETGTGANVFATSPALVTPLLGTPTSGVLTNCTGLPLSSVTGLAGGIATFLGTPSSANLISAVTDETGTGSLVFATSPTLVTPTIGVATATSINKVTITTPATSAVLTILNGKTLTANNTLTLAGTDSTTMTFPATSGTVATLNTGNIFTVNQGVTLSQNSQTKHAIINNDVGSAASAAFTLDTNAGNFACVASSAAGGGGMGNTWTGTGGISFNATTGPVTFSTDGFTERLRIVNSTGVLKFGSPSFTANNTVATVLGSVGPTGSHTTVQKWLTIQDNSGTTLYIPAF